MNKIAILLVAHFINETVVERYKKLRTELPHEKYDVIVLLNIDKDTNVEHWGIPFITYSNEQLNALEYTPICETVLPGSCHFTLLAFYKTHPTYHYYWFVEYDVYFTGSWFYLMEQFECVSCDFISCGLEKYDKEKNGDWFWWYKSNEAGYSLENCIRSFNPICRYSSQALEYLDNYLRQGHSAHSEVMISTALYNAGFTLEDLGGEGNFVTSSNINKFYIMGKGRKDETIRWRPVFEEIKGLPCNKIVHPFKRRVTSDDVNLSESRYIKHIKAFTDD